MTVPLQIAEGGDVMRVRKTDRKVAPTLSLQKAN
jgi:hypothetical protein